MNSIIYSLPLILLLMVGCSSDHNPEKGSMTLSVKGFELNSKAVNQNQIYPVLTLTDLSFGGTKTYSGTDQGNGFYAFDVVNISNERSYQYQIDWYELYRNRELALARANGDFYYGDTSQTVEVYGFDYDESLYDEDGDGDSNLQERRDLSNPFLPKNLDGARDSDIRVVIPKVTSGATVPNINGNFSENEWRDAVQVDIGNSTLYINRRILNEEGTDSNNYERNSRWLAMHDGNYLYIAVLVDDQSERSDSSNAWNDDNLNLYLDANWSHTDSYDGYDDFHYLIPLLKQFSSATNNGTLIDGSLFVQQGSHSAQLPSDTRVANGVDVGPFGGRGERMDVYEVRISLNGLKLGLGRKFGIDVHIDDDDNGNGRDSKWAWYQNDGDFSYQESNQLAGAVLEY